MFPIQNNQLVSYVPYLTQSTGLTFNEKQKIKNQITEK